MDMSLAFSDVMFRFELSIEGQRRLRLSSKGFPRLRGCQSVKSCLERGRRILPQKIKEKNVLSHATVKITVPLLCITVRNFLAMSKVYCDSKVKN